jgi:hypothetical protein
MIGGTCHVFGSLLALVLLSACTSDGGPTTRGSTRVHLPRCTEAPCFSAIVSYITQDDLPGALGIGCAGLPDAPVEGFEPLVWSHDAATETWTFSCLDQETGWSLSASLTRPRVQTGPCETFVGEDLPTVLAPSVAFDEVVYRVTDGREQTWVISGQPRPYCQFDSVVPREELLALSFGLEVLGEPIAEGEEPYLRLLGQVWLQVPSP